MNKKNINKFYVSTAIDYASGSPHIGHAYEKIGADVLARWNRNILNETFFLTGTDEHGLKIVKKAKEAKMSNEKFVENESKKFIDLSKNLNLSNDYFIKTSDEKHQKFVRKVLKKAYDNGDIYLDTYEGLYCVDCERYYTEKELLDDNICPDHKIKVEKIQDENYFFRLSKYQDKLLELYEKNPDFISPSHRKLEIINRVKEGLHDISISRSKKKLNWGIELPFDSSQICYVWFDALFNYISALDSNDRNEFWPGNVHIIGKDIMWFHMVYWPAFLMSVKYDLPKKVFAHGMILDENSHKMSKSLGNVIDPFLEISKYGLDEFRYFLLSLGSFGEDLSYSSKLFAQKINNELNNDFGNLVSRVHSMTFKYFNGIIPEAGDFTDVDKKYLLKLNIYDKFNEDIQNLKFNFALDILWTAIRDTNAYINEVEPWKITSNKDSKDTKRLETIIVILVSSIRLFGEFIDCFMPLKAGILRKQFNFKKDNKFDFYLLKKNHKLNEKHNLFSKVKLEKNEESVSKKNNSNGEKNTNNDKLKRTGFSSLDLRVGKIISVKQHPEAEKLFIEEIDLGEGEPRQIVSGLNGYYPIDDMIGRKVVVLCNLKPAKLRGVKSGGMVLVAEDISQKNLGFISADVKEGSYLVCDGIIADNPSRIKVDAFFDMDFKSDGNKVLFNKKEVFSEKISLKVDKKIKGNIC